MLHLLWSWDSHPPVPKLADGQQTKLDIWFLQADAGHVR